MFIPCDTMRGRMPSKLVSGLLALALTTGVAMAGDPPPSTPAGSTPAAVTAKPSGAKMYIEKTDFNFGYVPGNATISHSFFMYNKGTDTLKIFSVKPG